METPVIILISGCAAIILGLVYNFFGYKLARLLFPLCGLIVVEGLLYIYVYDMLRLDNFETWLFFAGSGVAVYVLLFFFKRIAGFFTGLLGSALFLLFIVNAFKLQSVDYVYPVCLTLCLLSAILTVVYERAAVVVFTSMFGACVAAFAGLYIYMRGLDAGAFSGGVYPALMKFLSENAAVIAGISAGFMASGILVQFAATASSCLLPGKPEASGFRYKRKPVVLKKTSEDFLAEDENMADSGF